MLGNDRGVAFAGEQGNFQLNSYNRVILHNGAGVHRVAVRFMPLLLGAFCARSQPKQNQSSATPGEFPNVGK